jgi:hypothetical protein
MIAPPSIRDDVPAGMTYYVRPCWVGDLNGWPFYAACDVATGRTLTEHEDVTALIAQMQRCFPHMALTENAVTAGCLRTVPVEERL